jgi:peroxiredoxin
LSKFNLGDSAPYFTLPAVSGNEYSFESDQNDHTGWHLLVFFRGSWCPVCQEDLKEIQESKSYFDDKKIRITAIATDTLDNLKEMAKEYNLKFDLLSDPERKSLNAYDVYYHSEHSPYEDHGAHGEPAHFLIDEHGKILYQQRQTSPFGRPNVTELRKIVKYISKNRK